MSTTFNVTDDGTGTEIVSKVQTFAETDSGHGTENATLKNPHPLTTEAGEGVDVFTVRKYTVRSSITDTFTRADSASMGSTESPVLAWTSRTDLTIPTSGGLGTSLTSTLGILSHGVYASTLAGSGGVATVPCSIDNRFFVQASSLGVASGNALLVVNYRAGTFGAMLYCGTGSRWTLTNADASHTQTGPVAAANDTIRIEVVDDVAEAFINGTSMGSILMDGTRTTTHGLGITSIDQLTPAADNFSFGELGVWLNAPSFSIATPLFDPVHPRDVPRPYADPQDT